MQVVFADIETMLPLETARQLPTLRAVLDVADIVTLHVPETPQTSHLLDADAIARMKPGSHLINASRHPRYPCAEKCIIAAMQLVGLLDSPFVRRVAVSLLTLRVPFEHRPVSVFRGFDAFRALNPVVKAPTLLADDGSVLMDSSLILQYVEAVAGRGSLLPSEPVALLRALRRIGLALAACEKTAQLVYERGLRPPEKQHQPWIDRVSGQLVAAFTGLEQELDAVPLEPASAQSMGQAGISMAVAWHFTQQLLPQVVPAADYPRLVALSAAAEALAEFRAAPYGEGSVTALA